MVIERKKNAPDFLIVGSAKSGTTSLWYYLDQHPDIFMNKGIKELGYFSKYYGINDIDEYLKYFDDAKENQVIGEACHPYLSSEDPAAKIFKFNPNMKIIMILRNPVYRAYSLYNWMIQHAWEHLETFEEALDYEEVRAKDVNFIENNNFYYLNYLYFRSGLYYEQVKRYLDIFPRDNIKIYIYEDFKKDNKKVVKDIFRFLNVNEDIPLVLDKQNESKRIRSVKLQFLLANRFIGYSDKLFIPRRISQKAQHILVNFNEVSNPPKLLSADTKQKLLNRYKDDIDKLSSLLNINLNDYWK